MDELDKRSMGMRYDSDAVLRQTHNGVSGYDLTPDESADKVDPLAVDQYRMLEDVVETRVQNMLSKQHFRELESQFPDNIDLVAGILRERRDALQTEGHPIDAVMHLEGDELAEEIVRANPEKDAYELVEIATSLVELWQNTHRLRQKLTQSTGLVYAPDTEVSSRSN